MIGIFFYFYFFKFFFLLRLPLAYSSIYATTSKVFKSNLIGTVLQIFFPRFIRWCHFWGFVSLKKSGWQDWKILSLLGRLCLDLRGFPFWASYFWALLQKRKRNENNNTILILIIIIQHHQQHQHQQQQQQNRHYSSDWTLDWSLVFFFFKNTRFFFAEFLLHFFQKEKEREKEK